MKQHSSDPSDHDATAPIWLRPQTSDRGRPAEHSRDQIILAAIRLADRAGLAAVTMRAVAAQLKTGPGSLYRHLANREDLLDLMMDAVAGEYDLPYPSGDPVTDLAQVAHQAREIMRRHHWLPQLVLTRPTLGPNGIAVMEHVLAALADHPADPSLKLEAFALLNGLVATLTQNEVAATSGAADAAAHRTVYYLDHVARAGDPPHLAAALQATTEPGPDRFDRVVRRILTGLLAP